MPLVGSSHSAAVKDEAPYFTSLQVFDDWFEKGHAKLEGVAPYPYAHRPRPGDGHGGQLLVCHDFKGGYSESPTSMGYTFNFWSYCDIFVYFAHHRVTIPPSGWTTAAHRQGVKMLGTLIFEHAEGEQDIVRLLVGRLPSSTSASSSAQSQAGLPLSAHYARALAELARQRGFDGYLLNVEVPLAGGPAQARMLAAWIALLREELRARVGAHAEAIWYDSVGFTGQLAWQDRLNAFNLPFFIPSTGFFTNYTWPSTFPNLTAQYLLSLPPSLSLPHPKTLRDIFVGIDVWGRGSHGGGGLGVFRALAHIAPQELGLSVALFGPGWTWESNQDTPGWNWDVWWARERCLWLGPSAPGEVIILPEMKRRPNDPPCEHGAFEPLTNSFTRRPAPDPRAVRFCTTFSPGAGTGWFVRGKRVLAPIAGPATGPAPAGWTDVDKQTTLGDTLWPRPAVAWEGDAPPNVPLPRAEVELRFDDAWLGGSSLRLSLDSPGAEDEDAAFRCVWVPVQAVRATRGTAYVANLTYKLGDMPGLDVDVDVALGAKMGGAAVDAEPMAGEEHAGWTALRVRLTPPSSVPADADADAPALELGLVIAAILSSGTSPLALDIRLGQLALHPAPPAGTSAATPRVLWAAWTPGAHAAPAPDVGVLRWETALSFAPAAPIPVAGAEDPTPAWRLQSDAVAGGEQWAPGFLYFNVYALRVPADAVEAPDPERAVWVGTTGLDGRAGRFVVEERMLVKAEGETLKGRTRWWVQGVTDEGECLAWERCAWVDV